MKNIFSIKFILLILLLNFLQLANAQTCTDGIQNGGETGIDCGGPCVPCVTIQDCGGAIPLCQNNNNLPAHNLGTGLITNEINPGTSCLTAGEINSVWYTFTVATSGNLCFDIAPILAAHNYDWAVFNITNNPCTDIFINPAMEVSCNSDVTPGTTGANGGVGAQEEPCFPVIAGETYVLSVQNPANSNVPYFIDFSASTASIIDSIAPTIQSVQAPTCNASSITFDFSEDLLCSSISVSDFTLTGPGGTYTLSNLSGIDYDTGGLEEDEFTLDVSPAITIAGTYQLCLVAGAVTDLCGNAALAECFDFTLNNGVSFNAGPDTTVCLNTTGNIIPIQIGGASAVGGTGPYTYAWSPGSFSTSNPAVNPSANTTYVVIATDLATGCAATDTVEVVINNLNAPTMAATPESCAGVNDGTATATPTNGLAAYTYAWTPSGSTAQTATNLADGVHTIVVTDAKGCQSTNNITVAAGLTVTAGIAPEVNQCLTGNSFNFNNTGSSGNGETYAWEFGNITPGPQGTSTNQNPTYSYADSGSFVVQQIVNLGVCADTATINVIVHPMPVPAAFVDSVNCNGESNGAITIALPMTVGTPPYTYSIAPGGVTANTSAGLTAGAYTITVTDANLCSGTVTTTVFEPLVLDVTEVHTNPSCFGLSDGTATATAAGGTPGYSYSWNDSGNQATATATGLSSGNYICTVTDFNGCTDTVSVTLTDPLNMVPGFTAPANQCLTGNSFTFTNTGTTGVAYAWDFGDAVPGTSTAQNPTYAYPAAGTFTVTQTVGTGACANSTTIDVTVYDMPVPTAIADSLDCNGDNDGIALVNGVTNSAGPFNYLWAPGGQTVNPAINLTANTYTVTITDQNTNCSGQTTVNLFEPTALAATETHLDPDCFDAANGTATVNPTGGTGTYSYSWDAAAGGQTTQTAINLTAGTYTCTITDFKGCQVTVSSTLLNPPGLTLSTSSTISNCETPDGTATVNVTSGGTPPFSFLWDAAAASQTTQTATGLAAGTYTVTITDDAKLCVTDTTVTVGSTVAITTTAILIKNAECNSETGSVYAVPTSGTGPYTYTWLPGGTTNDTLTAIAGNYTVTVTDQSTGCSGSDNIAISEPTAVNALITASNPLTCRLADDGNATAAGTGGTISGAYNFLWGTNAGSQTTATATNLAPGIYTVYVTDDNSCIDSATVTINDGPLIIANYILPANQCLTGNSFTFTNTGNTGGFTTYDWDFGDAAGTSTLEDPVYTYTAAGTYNVEQIVSEGPCADTITQTVTVYNIPSPIAVQDSVNCFGGNDGTAAVNIPILNGNDPYTFSWDDALNQTTNPATGLTAGTYTVTVTDSNTCVGTATITVLEPTPVVASITAQTNLSCSGADDGTATAAGAGGTGSYTYLWDANAANQTTATATNLPAGTYNVYVFDTYLCIDSASVTILDGALVTSTIDTTNILCNGGTIGAADLTPAGGTGAYTFDWSNDGTGDFDDNEDIAGLAAGTYYVTIRDVDLCTAFDTVVITEPTLLVTVLDSTIAATCNGFADGIAYTTTTGGTGPYTYLWNTAPAQNTDTASLLAFGVYNLTVTDNNNCQTTTIANINQPPLLDATSGSFNAYCALDQGSTWISPNNGTAPYTYAWDSAGVALGTPTTDTLTGLYPGNYNILVTDANGCQYNTTVTVNPSPGGTASISNATNVSCFGGSNGTATVSTAGAVPGFTYLWDDLNAQTVNPAIGLALGTYNVIVTDTLGCIMTTSVSITEPTPLTLTLNANDKICPDSCNADANAIPGGGTTPYTFLWNDPSNQISQTVNGLCPGQVIAIVTDSNGCTITDSVTIAQPLTMTLGSVITTANCEQADGSATVNVTSNGIAPFTFSWDSLGTIIGNNATLNNATAGTYYATATDSLGCSVTDTVNIPDLAGPSIALDSIYNVQCFNGADGYVEVQVSNGTAPYNYLWSDPIGQTTPSASNLSTGPYIVDVTDINGCAVSLGVYITQPDEIILTAGGTDPSCINYTDGSVWVNANGGNIGLGGDYTYTWNDPAITSNDTVYNLSSGTYTATVTDSNNCFKSIPVTLINPLLFTVNVTGIDLSCYNACNGSATTTLSNSVGVTTYLWDDPSGQTSANASGLCVGPVSVIATNGMGCVATDAVVLTQPDSLEVSEVLHGNVSCSGGSDGFSSLAVAGGTGAYTFLWTLNNIPVNTNQVANNLIAGSYTVTVSDGNGCTANITIIITEPNPLAATVVVTDADCASANTGSATVTVTGGTAPYYYLWNDAKLQQTAFADSLGAGTYQVFIQDTNGCSITVNNIIVDEPAAIALGITTTPSTCFVPNGTASVSFGGGTGTPTFLWDAAANNQITATATGLGGGNYIAYVTDQNGCTDSITANIADLGSPTVTIPTFTNVSCFGMDDGTAHPNVTGGTYPYSYLWNGGTNPTDSSATGLSGLVNGQNYNLTVTDNNGCVSGASVTITQNPPVIAVINDSNDVTCFGLANGDAAVIANGGTGPGTFTYSWGAASGNQTTAQATNLLAGTYTVTVTDADLCSTTDFVTILQPDSLNINNFSVDSITCSGDNDGIININVIGGTLPYTYAWTPPIGGAGPTAAGLPPGVYTVDVTDDHLCMTTGTYQVYTPDPLVIGTIATPSSCSFANGSVLVSPVTGGTQSYNYSWNTPGSPTLTALADNILAGTYTVTVTDANGCTTNDQATVIDEPHPVLDSLITINVDCHGNSTGSAVAYASGTAPISYSWDGGATYQAFGNHNNLVASLPLYTVIIKDGNDCTISGVTQITQPAPLNVNINAPNTACFEEVVQLFANGSGGTIFTPPNDLYNITWTTLGNATGQGPMTETLTNSVTYHVTIEDANGCTNQRSHIIDVSPQLFVNAIDQPICEGDSAILTATVFGGDPNATLNYTWEIIDSTDLSTTPHNFGNPIVVNPLDTTNYIVTVSDGCSPDAVDGLKVIVNPKADITLVSVVKEGCPGVVVDLKAVQTGPGTPISYQWDYYGDNNFYGTFVNSISNVYTESGIYDVSIITNTAFGCKDTITEYGHVTVYQNPEADFTTDPNPPIVSLLNPIIEFTDLSDPNNITQIRTWDFGDGSIGNEEYITHVYADTGTFNVSLTIENVEGCIDTITKPIRITPEFLFIIPNTITPNGDGLNDVFIPGSVIGSIPEDYGFFIFNKWGELLYEGHNITHGWDGTFEGKLVESGVYVWRIEILDFKGDVHKYNGHLNVLR